MYDSNVSKVSTPRKENSFQGYVGNDDHDNFGPLCKKPPLTIGYFKHFDSNKKVSFKVIDNGLLKQYSSKIQERTSSLINIEFDSGPVYNNNDQQIKTKLKSFGNKVNTNFQDNEMLKENISYKCLSLIMLDSVVRVN